MYYGIVKGKKDNEIKITKMQQTIEEARASAIELLKQTKGTKYFIKKI